MLHVWNMLGGFRNRSVSALMRAVFEGRSQAVVAYCWMKAVETKWAWIHGILSHE